MTTPEKVSPEREKSTTRRQRRSIVSGARRVEKSARLFDAQLTVHKFGYARLNAAVVGSETQGRASRRRKGASVSRMKREGRGKKREEARRK